VTDLLPLFILSFRQRDELAEAATRAGWRVVAARRAEGAARRLEASAAAVAVVDARGAVAEGLAAVRTLAAPTASAGGALLVLVSHNDAARLDDFYAAGATHFLASPIREAELAAAFRFAARHADRLGAADPLPLDAPAEPLGWRYDPATRSLQVTPALARAAGVGEASPPSALLAKLLRADRPAFLAAVTRVGKGGSTAFAHDVPGLGRAVHHIVRDARTGRLHALVEALGVAPDAGATLRELMPRRSTAALARDLPRAIATREIEPLFQPQVRIADGAIVGVEALARWRHGRAGELGAEALLAAASRAGLAVPLSDHLQARALEEASGWPAVLDPLRLSINITAGDLASDDFEARLLARIDASGFARARVTLEVTESELIEDLEAASASLVRLREAGCCVAIDDFGTGYSSLAYLNALPADYLKLDRRLTQKITARPRDRVIVRGVIAMAKSLGIAVIAEGVETEAQRELLGVEGCDIYQGFLCAPALDSAALAALLAR
jgi:EAL domain-containing protein (putative c-di-GMP-specific phosphodiesterase class I)/ActR/RegA family two-component response regulator